MGEETYPLKDRFATFNTFVNNLIAIHTAGDIWTRLLTNPNIYVNFKHSELEDVSRQIEEIVRQVTAFDSNIARIMKNHGLMPEEAEPPPTQLESAKMVV